MKTQTLFALFLSACFTACGGSSDAADGVSSSPSGGDKAWVTNAADLPSDEAGLREVYTDLMTEVVETMEGIDTKEQLDAGLAHISKMAPAFTALMERSDSLEQPVDEGGVSEEIDALTGRMETAMKSVLQKFPQEAMRVMNTFSDMAGGVGPR